MSLNIAWQPNTPHAPAIAVNDLVTIQTDNPARDLSGYVASMENGAARMHYGPTFPLSAVSKFVQRFGHPIPKGTQSLPVNGF